MKEQTAIRLVAFCGMALSLAVLWVFHLTNDRLDALEAKECTCIGQESIISSGTEAEVEPDG